MLKNLLLYRLAIFNAALGGLLGYLGWKGYITAALLADPTGITIGIALMFAMLLGSTAFRAWGTSKALNHLKEEWNVLGGRKKALKRMAKIKHIHDGSGWLAYLGLIGTVVGFVIAISGIDLGALSTAQGVQAMVPELMRGMGVALYTTLAGAFFGLWTEINYRMLATATECLVVDEDE
jgi:hypothetical protein